MSESKKNLFDKSKSDYIRYLYQEGVRKGIHENPDFYPTLIKFIDTVDGQQGFETFCQINPARLGITIKTSTIPFKRMFEL